MKRIGKRFLAFVLTAALMVSVCACGEDKPTGGSTGDGSTAQGSSAGGDGQGSSAAQGNGTGGGAAQDGSGGTGAETDEKGNNLQVIIHSKTKADFIIDNAYMEPGSDEELQVMFSTEDGSYCVKLESYSDELSCYLCRMPENMLVEDCAVYSYDGNRLTMSVNMGKGGVAFNLYDVEEYSLEYYWKGGSATPVFAAADVVKDEGALPAGGGGTVELASSLQVVHYNKEYVSFIVDNAPIAHGSNDAYQVIFGTKDGTYCVQVEDFGDEQHFSKRLCKSINAENTEFEPFEWGYGSTNYFTCDGDGFTFDVHMEDLDFDFNEVDKFTIRYLKNNGYDGQAEVAFAAADVRSAPLECFEYADDGNGGVVVTKFDSLGMDMSLKDVYIPRQIDGKPVTAIGEWAFLSTICGNVFIPDTVTKICSEAFRGAEITSVTIPESVTEIGEMAFAECDEMVSVTIRGGNAVIAPYAFHGYVTLSADQSTSYPANCLTSVDIDVKYIGEEAFRDNMNLESVNIVAETIGNLAFYNCGNCTVVISAEVIGDGAFNSSGVKELTLNEGLREIGRAAFQGCHNLLAVTIPGSVEVMGREAFDNCYNMVSAVIQEGVTDTGMQTFWGCTSLKDVTLPSTLTNIGEGAFSHCESLSCAITIPGGVKKVGVGAFADCYSLTDVVVEEGVEVLESSAFRQCYGQLSVSLPSSLNLIEDYVFSGDDNITITYQGQTYTHNLSSLGSLYKAVNHNANYMPIFFGGNRYSY